MINKNNHLVIMAGGVGSRFWPMSSEARPKQFLDIMGCGKTLIQITVDRFRSIIPIENVWIVTSAIYKDLVKEQLPDVPAGNILLEPCRRNTAPCVCYVSWKIKKRNPRANIVVAPSDHLVLNEQSFLTAITSALDFTAETDAIVTLGIKPTRPETGYGYIEADLSVSSSRKENIYRVDSFREKPSLEIAQEYVQQNNFFWNSGIFIWSVSTIVNAFRVYKSEMSKQFESLLPVYDPDKEQEKIDKLYENCESISVDYAIMEKAEDIFVYPADFGWSDLGTWGSLHSLSEKDNHGNTLIGPNVKAFDSHNCIVHATEEKEVVVQGLDGYIVVEKDGRLLICKMSEEQRIKLFHD
ncbi:MAG: mannose-1-phosphate guanylyltransferase [Bacteroidaceae bacterium]|nr:mannose-1-phosphate guanylyltransferase [Bacteroidaceae bacterium]